MTATAGQAPRPQSLPRVLHAGPFFVEMDLRHGRQGELGAERIAVRTNVRHQQETLVAANQFDEGRPVNWHGGENLGWDKD